MRKIVACAFVSLDGVMQAPGGPTEDPTGGFAFGGWLPPVSDDAVGEHILRLFDGSFDLLLGRRTYETFAAYWPFAGDDSKAIRDPFNRCTKYVVTHGDQQLSWGPSVRVAGIDELAAIKQGDGPDLIVQGSGTLYPQLLAAGLIDRLTLMTFPVVLGGGKRLFGEGTPPRTLRVTDHRVTERGNIIATYKPAGAVETGSFGLPSPSALEIERQQRMETGTW